MGGLRFIGQVICLLTFWRQTIAHHHETHVDYEDLFMTRYDMSFFVEARYSGDQEIESMQLLGEGLGLTTAHPVDMTKISSPDSPDSWESRVTFTGDRWGYHPPTYQKGEGPIAGTIDTYDDFTFSFRAKFKGESGTKDMKGQTYRITMPISRISAAFEDSERARIINYPFFKTSQGEITSIEVTSESDDSIGTRSINVYKPPNMLENKWARKYDLMFMVDVTEHELNTHWKATLDDMFATEFKETVVVVYGDWRDSGDRVDQLAEVEGPVTLCDDFELQGDSCTTATKGGNANNNIDFLLNEVTAAVNASLLAMDNERAWANADRTRTTITGHSLGGLFACTAAWKKPKSFGGAGCHSALFGWPDNNNHGHHFQTTYLDNGNQSAPRYPQRFVIDIAEHDHSMTSSSKDIYNWLGDHVTYTKSKNLFFMGYENEDHARSTYPARAWPTFDVLTGPNVII